MDPQRHVRRLLAAGCVAFLLVALGATEAFGLFRSSRSASTAVGTVSLLPPGNLTASVTCTGGSGKATVSIAWSISPSTEAAGHKVRITEGATTTTHTRTPRTANTDSYTTAKGTTSVTVTVWAFVQGWSSGSVTVTQPISC